MSEFGQVLDRDSLIKMAREEAGLTDFGDPWLLDNLEAFIPIINSEAELTEAGAQSATGSLVKSLVNRLRHVEYVKQNPAILDEEVNVAAIVVGLPRTGSTMLHRMLSATNETTGVRWWECHHYTPLPGEEPGNPEPRREAARGILQWMMDQAPELLSVHPMDIDQPDEEVIIQGQLFSSTMLEGTYHVPGYARWLMENSRTRSYADLKEILQSLQFQDKSRKGRKWVLKTPGHLMALDAALETFPDARIVMTHRDPVQTVPSYCSMMATVYHMTSDVSRLKIGEFWLHRLKELLDHFISTRKAQGSGRFIDVRYTDLTKTPIEEGKRVLSEAGIEITPEIIDGMNEWVEANRREDRAPHKYTLEEFGLSKEGIKELFADYREQFINQN